MFENLLRPKEVKATLLALAIERERIADKNVSQSFESIEPDLRKLIKKNKVVVVRKIAKEKVPANQLVLTLAVNVAFDKLCSGELHIYRGILSAQGNAMRGLWNHLVHSLGASGVYTSDEIQDASQRLSDEIMHVG